MRRCLCGVEGQRICLQVCVCVCVCVWCVCVCARARVWVRACAFVCVCRVGDGRHGEEGCGVDTRRTMLTQLPAMSARTPTSGASTLETLLSPPASEPNCHAHKYARALAKQMSAGERARYLANEV